MREQHIDKRGVEYYENGDVDLLPDGWAICLTCFTAWNDSKPTSVTPAPSGRCPFEYDHDTDYATRVNETRDDRVGDDGTNIVSA